MKLFEENKKNISTYRYRKGYIEWIPNFSENNSKV
jgi:hypothetical protein